MRPRNPPPDPPIRSRMHMQARRPAEARPAAAGSAIVARRSARPRNYTGIGGILSGAFLPANLRPRAPNLFMHAN